MLRRLLLAALLLGVGSAATAQEATVDSLLSAYTEGGPSGVVAVYRDGAVLFAKGYGLADVEGGIPNAPSTPYPLASVSKPFTAFAVALLADRGRLRLDDDVRAYLPDVPDFGPTITLRHLLHHTSGLREYEDLWLLSGGSRDDVIRREDLLRLVGRQRGLNHEPGAEYLYTNTGYFLLAEVVARVTGEPFGAWMEANVFGPLGMGRTHVHDDHTRAVPGRAFSYVPRSDTLERAEMRFDYAGPVGVMSTAEDLGLWLRNLSTAEVGGPGVIRRMEERGLTTSGDTLAYALGLIVDDHRGLRRLQHGGFAAGFRTFLAYYPEIDAGVVALGNVGSFNAEGIASAVAEAFFGAEMEARGSGEAGPAGSGEHVPDALLDAYAGSYQVENGPRLTVERTEAGLTGQLEGMGPPFDLVALADTLFRVMIPGVEASLGFRIEPGGAVEEGTIDQGGIRMPFHKVLDRAWHPSPDDLAAFAGRYFSPELETAYIVRVDGDRLVLEHPRHGEIGLEPREEAVFQSDAWFLGEVVFERAASGVVTGMRSTSLRARGLPFERRD